MKKVSVIILNYNGKQHLETYLPSVIKNTPLHIADIVVADNDFVSMSQSGYYRPGME